MKNTKELQVINFSVLNDPIRNSTISMVELLKHRGSDRRLFFFHLQGFIESSLQTYDAICDLVSSDRKHKYPAQATFLVRSIIDVFFSVVYMLDDLQLRSRQFELAGYHKKLKQFNLLKINYGNLPEWKDHLNEFARMLNHDVEVLKITDYEKNDKSINWPIPGRILRQFRLKESYDFLKEIYTQHYSFYSEGSHVSWGGMAMVVFSKTPDAEKLIPGKFESDAVVRALEFILMTLSEIQGRIDLGLKRDLQYSWGLFIKFWDEAAQYFSYRYNRLLE